MKNKIIVLTLFAGLLAGFAFKTIATDNTASNTAISWVSQAVPKPDSDGWITLFDGEHLRGCNPTNDCFRSGKIFVQNGSLWVDSVDIPFNLKAREVAFRVQAKKVSGQNFGITFGRDVAWFNGLSMNVMRTCREANLPPVSMTSLKWNSWLRAEKSCWWRTEKP